MAAVASIPIVATTVTSSVGHFFWDLFVRSRQAHDRQSPDGHGVDDTGENHANSHPLLPFRRRLFAHGHFCVFCPRIFSGREKKYFWEPARSHLRARHNNILDCLLQAFQFVFFDENDLQCEVFDLVHAAVDDMLLDAVGTRLLLPF